MGLFTLPKQYQPDFSNPKVKPSDIVEVDSDNEIVKRGGLEAAYVFDSETALRDYAKTHHGGIESGPNPNLIGTSLHGRALNFDGTTRMNIPDSDGLNFPTGQAFSLAMGVTANTTGSAEVLEKQEGSTTYYQFHLQSGTWRFYTKAIGGSARFCIGVTPVVAGDYTNIVCVRDPNANQTTIHINGRLDGTAEDSIGDMSPATALRICGGNLGTFDGKLYYLWIFRRALSPGEVQSLHLDPYQILKILTPINYLFRQSEVGPTDLDIDITQTLNSFTQSIQLTEISDHEIDIAQALNSFTQSIQLTEISDHEIGIAQSLNSFTQSISITMDGPVVGDIEIDIAQNLNSFTQSIQLTEISDHETDIAQSLNSFTQSIQLTEISDHEIDIAQNLNSFTQSIQLTEISDINVDIAQTMNSFTQSVIIVQETIDLPSVTSRVFSNLTSSQNSQVESKARSIL